MSCFGIAQLIHTEICVSTILTSEKTSCLVFAWHCAKNITSSCYSNIGKLVLIISRTLRTCDFFASIS